MRLLVAHGDIRERSLWPTVRGYFPLYEGFWRAHVVPLRDSDGYVRREVDQRLQLMAQAHYSCLVSLGSVLDALLDEEHPERAFSSLQNVANHAQKVIRHFNQISSECLGQRAERIEVGNLSRFASGVAKYRNYVHNDLIAMVDIEGVRHLPKLDKRDRDQPWSELQKLAADDFVPVARFVRDQFDEVVTLLSEAWETMLGFSPSLLGSSRYAQLTLRASAPTILEIKSIQSNVRPLSIRIT